ncbi:MAG: acyl transferase [Chryseolinea sp.]
MTFNSFASQIYTVNGDSFTEIALTVFRFQAKNNPTYAAFIRHLGVDISSIHSINQIPFLPISFFKSQTIKTGEWEPETVFTSSGTTSDLTSRHYLPDLSFYLRNAERCFEYFFGPVKDFQFMALLPAYLERQGSSLIAMMDHFIKISTSAASGFYLSDIDKLLADIRNSPHSSSKTILWGVSFALLDLSEKQPGPLNVLIFETGGMKGRRRELTRDDLHDQLSKAFDVTPIRSEYGMTELLSQAYTIGKTRFKCPPWMKIIGRELTDPLQKGLLNETAGINVIDLANLHSIAFIETEDLGRVYPDGSFEILGRSDNSDIRGCNLLIE